ncbi:MULTISPECIES: hypothetical protein [unclassified Cryobacterium]|uniref:hypothetical protein n=1 Tax=unclassified Cryobacterium TaxID=2649013 RepID=UPI001F543FB8|nr:MULTISPECIES: hypothetical protein [unclassified Cryobacterium]
MGANLFSRVVGLAVAVIAGGAALLLWFAVASTDPSEGPPPTTDSLRGIWGLFYDLEAPTGRVLTAAIALALLFAAGIGLLERLTARKSHRSTNRRITPLAPKLLMASTRGSSPAR